MTRLLLLLLLLFTAPQLPGVLCTVTTLENQEVFEGQSITVPCYYTPEYTQHVKYWCKGSMRDFCSTLARTDQADQTNGRITIADDPPQSLFTVRMHELKEEDAGWYWCGVEIGGMWTKDSAVSLYIGVIQGVSALNKEVSAEEGGSITVQCLYSQKHRKTEKMWCRSGHVSSCKVTSNGMFSSESLIISDDGKDTFTVTMRQLEMRDAGWYWCGAGEHKGSVNVSVTARSTITALDVNTEEDPNSYSIWRTVMVLVGVVMCTLAAGLATWMGWMHFSKALPYQSPLYKGLAKTRKRGRSSVVFHNPEPHHVYML